MGEPDRRASPDDSAGEAADHLTSYEVATRSPLFLDEWLEYNRRLSGVEPVRLRTAVRSSRGLKAVIYLDSRGRVVLPPFNPYLPVAYEPPPFNQPIRKRRHWLEAAQPLVEEMRRRSVGDNLILSPGVTDIRPWIWAGFRSGISYTTVNRLPQDESLIDRELMRRARHAGKAGYRWIRGGSPDDIVACMVGTERRKGFLHHFSPDDASLMTSLLGADTARTYVAYAPDGTPASSMIVLHSPGAIAISLVAGTEPRFLKGGASQYLFVHVLEDLASAGAVAWDTAGADIKGVALWKEAMGGELTPLSRIEPLTLRYGLRWARDWARQRRRSPEAPNGTEGTESAH